MQKVDSTEHLDDSELHICTFETGFTRFFFFLGLGLIKVFVTLDGGEKKGMKKKRKE